MHGKLRPILVFVHVRDVGVKALREVFAGLGDRDPDVAVRLVGEPVVAIRDTGLIGIGDIELSGVTTDEAPGAALVSGAGPHMTANGSHHPKALADWVEKGRVSYPTSCTQVDAQVTLPVESLTLGFPGLDGSQ